MAINSQGSTIGHDAGNSPHHFTLLEEVKTITGPAGTAALLDASHLGSSRKQFLPGLADSGQIQIDCNFIGGVQQLDLLRMFNTTADPEAFQILIPTTSKRLFFHGFTFQGIVIKWQCDEAVDAIVKLTMTIQSTGGVTYVIPGG